MHYSHKTLFLNYVFSFDYSRKYNRCIPAGHVGRQRLCAMNITKYRDLDVMMAHAEWLPSVQLRHLVPPVQYIQGVVGAGGCLVVVAQWQLKPGVLGSIPSDCQLFTLFHLIISKSLFPIHYV